MKKIDKKIIDTIIKDRDVRQNATQQSLWLFFLIYFSHYINYELADFHEEIIDSIQNKKNNLICVTAFRGSGKSTIITTASALWSVLGVQQKKFVLIICQTKAQAKMHMTNLKVELEENKVLRSDLGPFQEDSDQEWNASSITFSNTKARITIASLEQSIRGVRHRQTRPDLIILDDIEDSQSVKTLDSRDKTFNWFTSEIIPLGDLRTRIIIVGNLIHEDSMIMRIKNKIQKEELCGAYHEYPLINELGECLWPGKFPTKESLVEFEKTIMNSITWQREYLLKVVPGEYQIITRDMIHYYDEIPTSMSYGSCVIMGVDPAVSTKDRADYSAIVSGLLVFNDSSDGTLYVLSNLVNKRFECPDLIEVIKSVCKENRKLHRIVKIIIESNAFQEAVVQSLHRDGYTECEGRKSSEDKRTRLSAVSYQIKSGSILFPREGAEELLAQMIGFGAEKHDDLVDAFTFCAQTFVSTRPQFIGFV